MATGNFFLVRFSLRLSVLFVAILLEFALNALFYNLEPSEEEGPFFWEGFIENFWVAAYSFFIVLVPLFILGVSFSASSQLKKLKRAENAN